MRGVTLVEGLTLPVYTNGVIVAIREDIKVKTLAHIVEFYIKIPSSKVNWATITALNVGKLQKPKPDLPEGPTWATNGIKYLGVHLGTHPQVNSWQAKLIRFY